VRLAMRDALHCTQLSQEGKLFGLEVTTAAIFQDDQDDPLSEWMRAEASLDLLCQQIRGSSTAERLRACLPRFQRFLGSRHRNRPHLYSQVSRWLGTPDAVAQSEDLPRAA
jgi:hypothetical protein